MLHLVEQPVRVISLTSEPIGQKVANKLPICSKGAGHTTEIGATDAQTAQTLANVCKGPFNKALWEDLL